MIAIRGLEKSFGRNQVIRGMDLVLDTPGVTAILGPNASGKTTLIKSILGMVVPDHGDILINGESILGKWKYRDKVDYLPQIARFPDNLRVRELFSMIDSLRSRNSRADELIDYFELGDVLNQKLGHLSGGTRQKVNIVVAFMYDNPLVMLDEPSAGLDPVSLLRAKDLIRSESVRGKLILITSHIMGLVEELADRIVFLLDGSIHFNGSISDLRTTYDEPTLERCIARMLEMKTTSNVMA